MFRLTATVLVLLLMASAAYASPEVEMIDWDPPVVNPDAQNQVQAEAAKIPVTAEGPHYFPSDRTIPGTTSGNVLLGNYFGLGDELVESGSNWLSAPVFTPGSAPVNAPYGSETGAYQPYAGYGGDFEQDNVYGPMWGAPGYEASANQYAPTPTAPPVEDISPLSAWVPGNPRIEQVNPQPSPETAQQQEQAAEESGSSEKPTVNVAVEDERFYD